MDETAMNSNPKGKIATTAAAVFLFCFILFIGLTRVYYGIVEGDFYNAAYRFGRLGTPAGLSTLGQDFAFAWNASKNLESPKHGILPPFKCFSPNRATCRHSFPPLLPLLYMKFAHFDSYAAYRLYVIFIIVCWLVCLYAFSRHYSFTAPSYVFFTAVIALSFPSHIELERGQQYTPILVPVFLGFYLLRQNRDALVAAMLVSAAALMKLFPGIFIIYFGVKRQYKFCIYSILFLLLFVQLSGGVGVYIDYAGRLSNFINILSSWAARPANHSTWSTVVLLSGSPASTEGLQLLSKVINVALASLTLGYVFFMRIQRTRVLLSLEVAMLMIVANVTPKASFHYTLVVIPFVVFSIIGALDHAAIRKRLKHAWLPIIIVLGFISADLLLVNITPLKALFHMAGVKPPAVFQYPWFNLIGFWFLSIVLHWTISRSSLNDENRHDNSDRSWWKRWFLADFGEVSPPPITFEKGNALQSLALLIDGARYTNLWRGLMVRVGASVLIAYLLIFSSSVTFRG